MSSSTYIQKLNCYNNILNLKTDDIISDESKIMIIFSKILYFTNSGYLFIIIIMKNYKNNLRNTVKNHHSETGKSVIP